MQKAELIRFRQNLLPKNPPIDLCAQLCIQSCRCQFSMMSVMEKNQQLEQYHVLQLRRGHWLIIAEYISSPIWTWKSLLDRLRTNFVSTAQNTNGFREREKKRTVITAFLTIRTSKVNPQISWPLKNGCCSYDTPMSDSKLVGRGNKMISNIQVKPQIVTAPNIVATTTRDAGYF